MSSEKYAGIGFRHGLALLFLASLEESGGFFLVEQTLQSSFGLVRFPLVLLWRSQDFREALYLGKSEVFISGLN